MWWLLMACSTVEIPYDGVDQDGDGVDLVDMDGDGEPSVLAFGRDCNDRDASIGPHVEDVDGDGVDADCGGSDASDAVLTVSELRP